MRTSIALLLLFVIVFTTTALSQSIPVGLMPMQYNGSFAGSAGNSRISSAFMLESYQVASGGYEIFRLQSQASYDRFYPKLRSGVGITISNTTYNFDNNFRGWAEEFVLSSINIDFAPKFPIKGKYTISPSVSLRYFGNFIEYVGDSVDLNPPLENGYNDGLTSRLGVLFNSDRYYIGFSFPLFRATFQYINWSEFRTFIQLGYTFQESETSKFSFTPQLLFDLSSKSNEYDKILNRTLYNLGFRYGQWLGSVIGEDELMPIGFQLGWQNNGWRILSINQFDDGTYSPGLSLRYIFNQNKQSIHIYDQNF